MKPIVTNIKILASTLVSTQELNKISKPNIYALNTYVQV
jgi:hypothetical protein